MLSSELVPADMTHPGKEEFSGLDAQPGCLLHSTCLRSKRDNFTHFVETYLENLTRVDWHMCVW